MKRTPLKRKSGKPKRKPSEVCDWSGHGCRRRADVKITETERYCNGHATDTADTLVGTYVKMRDNWTCQLVGFNDKPCYGLPAVYWCHLIPKGRYQSVRWNPSNAITGCAGHHKAFDESPLEKDLWIEQHILGVEGYAALKHLAMTTTRPPVRDVILEFRSKVAA